MSIISRAWRRLFPKRKHYYLHVQEDKNGRWRWHIADITGKRKTLMSGPSHATEAEALDEASDIALGIYRIARRSRE